MDFLLVWRKKLVKKEFKKKKKNKKIIDIRRINNNL